MAPYLFFSASFAEISAIVGILKIGPEISATGDCGNWTGHFSEKNQMFVQKSLSSLQLSIGHVGMANGCRFIKPTKNIFFRRLRRAELSEVY